MSRKSEREAAAKVAEILEANGQDFDVHGAGKLTKSQRKSQERYIPVTDGPSSAAGRIARKLWG